MEAPLPRLEAGEMADWEFYRTASGNAVVSQEVKNILAAPGRAALGALLDRIQSGETLPSDVGRLDAELLEARLTWDGQEFRVHFARTRSAGEPVLLAVRAVNKKTRKVKQSDLKLSKTRLRDWQARNP